MFHLVLSFALPALAVAQALQVRSIDPVLKEKISIGSIRTTIEDFPYQISVLYRGSHKCGGSIISSTKVLTTALCVSKASENDLLVRAGSSRYDSGGDVLANVKNICTHPKYNPKIPDIDNDVSVLTLECALPTTNAIQPISLIQPGISVTPNLPATLSGWRSIYSTELQKIDVRKISQQDCNDAYGTFEITESMTCYGWPNSCKDGGCKTDLGNPLAIGRILVGIFSWSVEFRKPGVYVDLAKAIIRNHINSC